MAEKVTGAAFWQLMDRWKIPDAQALALIDHPPAASGRPRFAMGSEQITRLTLLREIEQAAAGIYGDAATWLRKPNSEALFGRRSPVAMMAEEGIDGMERVLHQLQESAWRAVGTTPSRKKAPASHA